MSPELEKGRQCSTQNVLGAIKTENFPKLEKTINLHIQKALQIPNKINVCLPSPLAFRGLLLDG